MSIENMNISFAKRLLDVVRQRETTLKDVSNKIEVSYEILRRYTRGLSTPRANTLFKLAKALHVDPIWLQTGAGDPNTIKTNVGEQGILEPWDEATILYTDEVEVPFFRDIKLSAGGGFADDIQDYNGFKMRFSKADLRNARVDSKRAVCLEITGDSMEPLLPHGAIVGIDLDKTDVIDGKIYAVNHGGLLRVKQLYAMPNHNIRLHSFNTTNYIDEIASLEKEEVFIIGKVFWWSSFA